MHFQILYGVSKKQGYASAYDSAVFVNGAHIYTTDRAMKTPGGALRRAEKLANEIANEKRKFNNTAIVLKWEHSFV